MVTEASTAINTFRLKYSCLPGDCTIATSFFSATEQPDLVTDGDGNGIVRAFYYNLGLGINFGTWGSSSSYESRSVWEHLARADIINLTSYDETHHANFLAFTPQSPLKIGKDPNGYPSGDIKKGLAFGWEPANGYITAGHKIALGSIYTSTYLINVASLAPARGHSISIQQAYSIDSKIDDGKPFSGKVVSVGRFGTHDVGDVAHATLVTINSRSLCGNVAENRYRFSDPAQHNGQNREFVCRLHIDTGY